MKKFKMIIGCLLLALILPFNVKAADAYAYSKYINIETRYNEQTNKINLAISTLDVNVVSEDDLANNIQVNYYTLDGDGNKITFYQLFEAASAGGSGDADAIAYDYSYSADSLPNSSNCYVDISVYFETANYIATITIDYSNYDYVDGKLVSGVTETLSSAMISNLIPSTLTLGIKESEFTHQTIKDEVKKALDKYLSDNGYDLDSLGLYYTVWYGNDYGESSFYKTYVVDVCDENNKCYLGAGKTMSLTYSNSSDKNDEDAQYVKDLISDKTFYFYTPNEFDSSIVDSFINLDTTRLEKYINDLINDDSIKIYLSIDDIGGSKGDFYTGYFDMTAWAFLFKDDVYYQRIYVGEITTYQIEVPYDTDEDDYLDIVGPIVEAYIKDISNNEFDESIISIKKVEATSSYVPYVTGDTFYALTTDGDYGEFVVSIVKGEKEVPITSVSLNKTTLSLTTGKSEKVTATINPSDTTDSKVLTWTSSNTKVATVDGNGTIKAIAVGTATITVKTSNGKTATVKVTVSDPVVAITSVKINESSLIVAIGKTKKLTATINPSNTTQSKTLTWSSSNTKVATVDSNGNVKGIKAGTATITVKTSNGKTASLKVTVKKATPIKSVKLNKSSAKLAIGKTLQLKATINPTATTDDTTLTWSSSNKKVATVDSNGKVTAIAAGTAKITVKTSNGKKKTIKVTVSKISAKKAKIAAIENQVQTGKAIKPTVTVTLNGTTLKSGTDYTVTYKNNKKAGKATVTVKFKGNYTGTVKTTFLIIPKKVSIKNPTTTKKAITVKYTKVSGATTYQIAYRVKGTTEWKYTTSTSASKKISKLTSGKEYEVMVRAGIKSGSKKLYGEWSDVKTITVK